MKQLWTAIFLLGLSVMSVQAQDNKNAPAFKFNNGVTHDFGTLNEGPDVTHYFEFTNVGKEPLIVQTVTASCGCTTPDWPKQPILPGKTGKIKVVYSTKGRVGPFTKQIFIQSNAVNPDGKERYELEIKGNVKAAEDATPKS